MLLLAAPAFAQETGAESDPAYGTLADLIEDDSSRNALIEELRALQAARASVDQEGPVPAEQIAAESPSDQQPEEVSFARRMAATTGNLAANMGDQFAALGAALGGLVGAGQARADQAVAGEVDLQEVGAAAVNLAILVIATFVVFFVLRAIASPAFRAFSAWAQRGSEKFAMLRTIVAVAVAALVDVIVVGLAYVAGGFVSSLLVNEVNADATRLALFLNAFLVVELVKAALRMMFSSGYEGLRLMPVGAGQARYANRFLANLAGFIGYGMLVLVPILNFHMSPVLGTAVGTLVMLLALFYAVAVILKKRTVIRDRLLDKADATSGPGRVALGVSARLWHLAALAYALMVFAVTVINPETALPYVAMATLETLIYVGAGLLVSVVLTQLIGKEIQLSDRVNEKLPRLQARVNTYVPTGLKVVRALILALVVVLSLDAWEVYDLAAWYATAAGAQTVGVVLHILIILAVAAAVWIGIASLLEHKLTPAEDADPATVARANTLMGLFHTTLAIAIIIMTLMIVLAEIGINIGPLIAGAGVLGLAIGFGAQKLVQDVITGVFIQLENAMNTGDFVTAGSNSGTVERVGIRSVALRDLAGTYHIVPFSSVDAVSNYTREYGNHVGEYGIGYRESIDDAIVQLEAAFEELKEGPHKDNILAPMTVAGVTALADSSVNIRVVIKAAPGMQWAVGRAYNRLVKIYFDKAGIEIPFPHTTLYFGEDRDGNAPPANVRMLNDERVVDTQQDGTSSDRSE
ncbi:MAG TPA: mechanosensitive ion channel [Alcanivorax sp.]|nr:mechanosensitive ion channel [Alcanivorax sp.]